MQVKQILIPNKPHLDPIAAIYLLQQYGKNKFPGIELAKVIFWQHSNNPTNEEIAEFQKQGILIVDVGGSIFDHHDGTDIKKETTTSLVASYLGIESNPEISTLLNYIREDDLEGLHNRYGELAYLIKCLHKQNVDSERVVNFTLQALNFLQLVQSDWHLVTKKEFEEKCKIYKIKHYNRNLKIGVVESDNNQLANYGITTNNLSVVVQKRSTGHVMILTNKNHRVNLKEIISAIRMRELELRGFKKIIDPKKLQFEGKNSLIPNWFYHRSLNAFMNGSDALTKTEPTKVPFREIINFIWYGLSSEDSGYCDCSNGGQHCPFAAYGFNKCEDKRSNKL